jgi:exonuclease SbcC
LELEAKLKAFVSLDQEINEQHSRKDRHAEDHKLFLGAQPLAATLDERREVLRQSAAAEQQAEEQVRQKNASFESASRDFDPAALEKARNHAAEAGARLMIDEKALQSAERELQMERERLKQWKEACRERDRIEGEASRLRAAGELAKLAGKVLKGAAPAVAQHLCSRIAANAQRLFNQLNQEPIELEWKAEPQYGLRIGPGERRFAMLSGGEQTKLAVAMTLAMIQEFSALRFAVFDEPTYAVDAESRPKLADAILEAQKAAGLDQLIIGSHDDAFEGRIENVVVLRKLAGSGTELLNSPPLQPPVRP